MRTKRSSDQTTTSSSAAKPANNDQGKESRSEKAEKTTEKDNKVTAVPAEVAKELELREDILPPGIPSFRVNDNSRVEVTLSSHEFETSMAKNDFSSQSTEASLYVPVPSRFCRLIESSSGGYAGFSASVSGGYSNSKSNTNKATVNVYKKTMIASYMVRLSSNQKRHVLKCLLVSTSGHNPPSGGSRTNTGTQGCTVQNRKAQEHQRLTKVVPRLWTSFLQASHSWRTTAVNKGHARSKYED